MSVNGVDGDATAPGPPPPLVTEEGEPYLSEIITYMRQSIRFRKRVPLKDVMAAMQNLRAAAESKKQVVGPSAAGLLLKCTGKALTDVPRAERAQMSAEMWNLLHRTGLSLDTSHYNMLLSVKLMNEEKFSPTEFLSSMESKGVAPNKATFELLVANFCRMGDMNGAMEILSYMKEAEMLLDHFIFHSLIMGHCVVGDYAAAQETVETMSAMGLDVGAATHLSHLIGMVKGGAAWEEVKVEFQKALDKGDISFDDESILKLMHELSRANKREGARELMNHLPRSTNYLNSIRNRLPPIIFDGDVDLAMEIYDEYLELHGSQEEPKVGERELERRPHSGTFIFNALAKVEHPPERVIGMLKRHAPTNSTLPTQMIEYCAVLDKVPYAKRLIERIKAEDDLELFTDSKSVFQFAAFARGMANDEAIRLFANMVELGVDFNGIKGISKLVMPHLSLDDPMDTVVRIMKALERIPADRRAVSYLDLGNAAIRQLLSRNDLESMHKALYCASRKGMVPLIMHWSFPLADSFCITGDTDTLVHFLTLADRPPSRQRRPDKIKIFSVLKTIHSRVPTFCPHKRADEVLSEVLDALKRKRIGLTENAGEELVEVVKDPAVKDLIVELQHLRKDSETYWTPNRREQARLAAARFSARANEGPYGPENTLETQSPSMINGDSANNSNQSSTNPATSMKMTETLLSTNKVDEAADLVRSLVSKGFPQYMRTVSLICIEMIRLGQYGEVEQFLKDISWKGVSEDLRGRERGHQNLHLHKVMECLATESKDAQLVAKFGSFLREAKFGIDQRTINSYVISAHVANQEYERAVAEFEDNIHIDGVHPWARTPLSIALLEMGDEDGLRRVNDAISRKHGEGIGQYNLVLCFLILGRYSEARKALDSPGLVYRKFGAILICSELKFRKDTVALEKFVSATRNLPNCDRAFLYNELIEAHRNNGETDKLTEVLMQMQEEGVATSRKMRETISNTFLREGRADPFTDPISR